MSNAEGDYVVVKYSIRNEYTNLAGQIVQIVDDTLIIEGYDPMVDEDKTVYINVCGGGGYSVREYGVSWGAEVNNSSIRARNDLAGLVLI